MKKVFTFIAVAVALCITSRAAEQTLLLSGNDWRIYADAAGTGEQQRLFDVAPVGADWLPATVPGNIQADVEAAHLLRPLWYGGIDTNLYEVARKDWWYRKDFVVPASFAGKRLTLVCDGVDERC
jgi:beta-mannosidase